MTIRIKQHDTPLLLSLQLIWLSIISTDDRSSQHSEALRKECGYFHKNRKRMNYLDLRSEGIR
jgi:hypothetical protein